MELFKNNNVPGQQSSPAKPIGNLGPPGSKPPAGALNVEKDLNEMARKLRLNEERTIGLRKKIQMIEHNLIMGHKKFLSEIKFINQEISDMKREFDDLKSKILDFARELQNCAKKEDVQVLERYVNMWEPVNFVSRNEVEKIIDEKLNKK